MTDLIHQIQDIYQDTLSRSEAENAKRTLLDFFQILHEIETEQQDVFLVNSNLYEGKT